MGTVQDLVQQRMTYTVMENRRIKRCTGVGVEGLPLELNDISFF